VNALRTQAISITVAAALFAAAVALHTRLDPLKPTRDADDYNYLPNEQLLTHFTAGMDSLIANLLWIECCTYVGRQVKGDWNFQWLKQMVTTVTRLDPYFVDAYRYGGIFLSTLNAQDDVSLELLQRGMVKNPYAWELPYEAAMIYLLNRKEQPDARAKAAHYLALAVETGNAPEYVTATAAALQGELNLKSLEMGMWEQLAQSDDQLIRDLARQKQLEVSIRDNLEFLDGQIAKYVDQRSETPQRLEQLVEANLIDAVVRDPLGGEYFLSDGAAYNTTLLTTEAERIGGMLRRMIGQFERQEGHLPASLQELVDAGIAEQVPPHPWPGQSWDYDAATGSVS